MSENKVKRDLEHEKELTHWVFQCLRSIFDFKYIPDFKDCSSNCPQFVIAQSYQKNQL